MWRPNSSQASNSSSAPELSHVSTVGQTSLSRKLHKGVPKPQHRTCNSAGAGCTGVGCDLLLVAHVQEAPQTLLYRALNMQGM